MAYEITFRTTLSDPGASKLAQPAGCPLEVEAVQVAHDAETGKTFLQSKIRNVGAVPVTSLAASFVVNPADGSPARVEALTMDDTPLGVGEDRSFAVATTVHDVRDVAVSVDRAAFDGGATWPGDVSVPAGAEPAPTFAAPTTPMAPGAPTAPMAPGAPVVPTDATQVMPAPATPIAPGYNAGTPVGAGAPAPAPKKSKAPMIIAVVVVALLAVGGIGFAMGGRGDAGHDPATPAVTSPKTTEPQTTKPQTTTPKTDSGKKSAEKILVGHWAGTALMGDGNADNMTYYSDDNFYADFYDDGTVFWSLDDEDDGSWWGTWEVDPDQDTKGRTYFLVDFDDAHWLAATQDADDNEVLYMTSINDSDYGVVFERD